MGLRRAPVGVWCEFPLALSIVVINSYLSAYVCTRATGISQKHRAIIILLNRYMARALEMFEACEVQQTAETAWETARSIVDEAGAGHRRASRTHAIPQSMQI